MLSFFWLVATYAIGSIPFGLFVGNYLCKTDVRNAGSKNTGATNVARLCGFRFGVLVLALDLLKGCIPVAIAASFNDHWLYLSLVALAAIVGHMYSCWMGFKGGKGFATAIGVFIPLAFWPLLVSVLLVVGTIKASGFVSLGALMFGAALPIMMILSGNFALFPVALAVGFLMYWKHQENIMRLAKGEENPWRRKKN